MRIIFFFVLLFFRPFYSLAQNLPTDFQIYQTKDGLSSNTICGILKDSYGFLWLATEDGLNRFDGTNYKIYKHNPRIDGGLKSNYITTIHEDVEGNIWIGTNGGGLSYYDRKRDSILTYQMESTYISAAVNSIMSDGNGDIWIASYGNLYVIDQKTKKIRLDGVYKEIADRFQNMISFVVFKDTHQRMWVGTDNGLYLVSNDFKDIEQVPYNKNNDNISLGEDITSIIENEKGKFFVGTMKGLYILDQNRKYMGHYGQDSSKGKLSSDKIYALETEGDLLWIGTDKGLDIMDVNSLNVTSFKQNRSKANSLSSSSIRSLYIDPLGIYWIGTFQGGLNKYDTNLNQFNLVGYNAFASSNFHTWVITSFAEYNQDVYFGTDGEGLHKYSRDHDKVEHIDLMGKDKTNNLIILAIEVDYKGQIWLGTYMGGLLYYDPVLKKTGEISVGTNDDQLNHTDIFCLKEDRNGDLWIGTNGGGINVLRSKTNKIDKYLRNSELANDSAQLSNNYIKALEEDHLGNMWIGTFGGGISVFNAESKSFDTYNKENSSLPNNYVLSIKQDKNGDIWVGTKGNGIGLLKKHNDRFDSLTEADGLINDVVQSIVEDQTGKLWFATNNGLSSYDKTTEKFKNYSQTSGLQSGSFMRGAGIALGDGELFFGGEKGFNHFNPSTLKNNLNPANVVLTVLKIDNKVIQPSEGGPITSNILLAEKINLKFKQNFSISFEGLNFTIPEDNQYEYMLEGFDKEWIQAGLEHSAYYTNLDPGEYVFMVKASNNDRLWNNEVKSIKVSVAPPLWRTIYAYILYVLVFLSGLFYIRRQGIRKLEEKFALEQERLSSNQIMEQQRKEAQQLHKLAQMKIKFLTNLSHEFRTPTALIIGPLDNLVNRIKDKDAVSQLNLVKRNAKRLQNLVNQLLDFRKMEEHELKLQDTDGELVDFVKEVCNSFRDMAKQKGIDYSFNSSIDKIYAVFDLNKMERVLFNLISNAFKFTPKGGDISIKLEEVNESSDSEHISVKISIKDSGIGIPKDAQKSIFENFFQHDLGGEIINQGTGIGLTIAQAFVKMYEGTIKVKSEVGNGSCFSFTLRLKRSKIHFKDISTPLLQHDFDRLEHVEDTSNNSIISPRPSILIVEDEEDFRFYLKENLKSSFQVFEATNGVEGWQKALFHHPNIIISDVHMPLMNGFELAQKLKTDNRTQHIPIILLTAAQTENGLVSGLESGAIDYMTKPFDIEVLHAKVNSLLSLNQAFKDTYSKQVSIVAPEIDVISEKEVFIQNLLSYIYENINNPQLSVTALSAHLSISRASLYNRLLEYTGMSPIDFIRSVKLERAVLLLEKSDKTIAEIAYETGFSHPNYFTKVFKSKYQKTPSNYLKSLENKKEKEDEKITII